MSRVRAGVCGVRCAGGGGRRVAGRRAVCARHVPYPTPYMECDFNALKRERVYFEEDIVFCRDLRKHESILNRERH